MSAILNSLNAHNLPIFQPILMILVSKFMVYRALSDKTYLSLMLLSPLNFTIMLMCKMYDLATQTEDQGHTSRPCDLPFNSCLLHTS